jgi:hypothetical protein
MADTNLAVKKADGTIVYLKVASGTGTDIDPYVMQNASTLLAGTANIGDVDIASIAAGTNLIGKVGIDQATANANEIVLKSGSAAIGKLAANSGVDIGDVDVTSITAGENHLGEFGGKTTLTPIVFSLDTSPYSIGDVLATTQILASCLRVNDGTGLLVSAIFNDKDNQGFGFDVYLLNSNNSLGTENSPPNISDANADSIIGWFAVISTDWKDLVGCKVAQIKSINMIVKGVPGTDDLYVALVAQGAGTYSAAGITGWFGILCD